MGSNKSFSERFTIFLALALSQRLPLRRSGNITIVLAAIFKN